MKSLKMLGGIVLCVISFQLTAQVKAPLNDSLAEKPTLFHALPDKCNISRTAIEKVFAGAATGVIKIPIENNNKILEGELLEKRKVSADVVTVNIRLPYYDDALFTISKFTAAGSPVHYLGRIIHIRYGDVLILKTEGEALYLVKEKQSLFLVE